MVHPLKSVNMLSKFEKPEENSLVSCFCSILIHTVLERLIDAWTDNINVHQHLHQHSKHKNYSTGFLSPPTPPLYTILHLSETILYSLHFKPEGFMTKKWFCNKNRLGFLFHLLLVCAVVCFF